MKRILGVLTALFLLGWSTAFPVLAQTELRPVDVGNFNDYTGGGSSWDSGGSSWSYDSGGSSYYSGSSSSGSGSLVDFLIGAGVVAVIVVVVVLGSKKRGKKGGSAMPHMPSGAPLQDNTNAIVPAG